MKEVSHPLRFWPVLAGSTFLSTPGVEGLILENRTGNPVAGARVYAVWKRHLWSPDGKVAQETAKKVGLITSEDGCFEIPPYFLFNPAPSPGGHAGSFAFMVFADGYKTRLYTFRDPESLTSYGSYDLRELAPVSYGERMTIRLSKISDSAREIDHPGGFGCGSTIGDPEAGGLPKVRLKGELADGYYSLEDYRAAVNRLDTAPCDPRPAGEHVRERVIRARKKLAEDSKK